jgi:hypothetical protein
MYKSVKNANFIRAKGRYYPPRFLLARLEKKKKSYLEVVNSDKAVNREDKRSRRYRDRDFAKFERSRRYRDR